MNCRTVRIGIFNRVWAAVSCAASPWVLLTILVLQLPDSCGAHVLQHMSWFETSREVEIDKQELRIIHTCRFLPGRLDRSDPLLDTDADTTISQHEIANFCNQTARYLAQDVAVLVEGVPCRIRQESFLVFEDSTGFRSEILAAISATSPTLTLLLTDPAFLVPASVTGARLQSLVQCVDPAVSVLDARNEPQRQLEISPVPVSTLRLTRQSAASPAGSTTQPMHLTSP